ncbi:MAG: YbhN family protein [Halanaerobium sp.]
MAKKEKNFIDKYFNLKNSLLYFALFVLISAVSLYYINKIFSQGSNLNIFFSFPTLIISSIFGLLFFYYIFDALRLYFVLKTLKADISFWNIYKLVFINIFISNITPLATGGGFAQVYFLQKKGIPLGKSSAAVIIRTLLSATMLFLSVPLIVFQNQSMLNLLPGNYVFIYLAVFLVLYVFIFYLIIFKVRLIMKLIYKVFYFLKSKHLLTKKRFRKIIRYIFKHLKLFSKDLAFFIQGKKIFVFLSFLFTVIFLLAEFSFSYLVIRGLGYNNISFFQILTLQILVVFIMYFAPTPGAAGIAEGGYSLLFARFVDQSDLFPLLFYWRFFSKYIGIFIGIFVFFYLIIRGGIEVEE